MNEFKVDASGHFATGEKMGKASLYADHSFDHVDELAISLSRGVPDMCVTGFLTRKDVKRLRKHLKRALQADRHVLS